MVDYSLNIVIHGITHSDQHVPDYRPRALCSTMLNVMNGTCTVINGLERINWAVFLRATQHSLTCMDKMSRVMLVSVIRVVGCVVTMS